MATKRKGLGRGLDALLGSAAGAEVAEAEPETKTGTAPPRAAAQAGEGLQEIAIDLLQRGRYQPRIDMRQDSLEELAESIKAQGVVQPIVVRPVASLLHGEPRYEIVAGERRWRAAQLAGLDRIPALVREIPDQTAVAVSLIENIQREDLNPIEEARALERLIEEFSMTHQQAADAVGRSRAAVTNLLRLLELADEVRAMVERRELEMGHARALLGLPGGERQQAEIGRTVAKKGLSVRETERLVRRLAEGDEPRPQSESATGADDPDIRRLETEISEKLGAKVAVRHSRKGRGRLVIDYHSLDELEGILERIR